MKKIYQRPTVSTVIIHTGNMLQTTSKVGVSSEDYSGGEKLSRGGTFWGDDDE